ncbi:MAG: formate dehydrogenase accessory sulfurtransferase FdhD [Anaerolineae bacterium]|nr:formate dehydrogenase accessory sulfurtransferase FdhD [Anaerolineae bacterium]
MTHPIFETEFVQYQDGASECVGGAAPVEEQIVLQVNALELVGLMCTPVMIVELALGFLLNEGLIEGMDDVFDARVCGSGRCVDVWLHKDIALPTLRTITSGCSGGTTFETLVDARHPVASALQVTPDQICALMRQLHTAAVLYRQTQGIHTSALAQGMELICVAEDVGRHNTLDKLTGRCLLQGIPTRDRILLTSGRISSEMLNKAARMHVPVVVSRTSPTSLSVELARAWGITLIGYARGHGFRVYSGAQRVVS